MPRFRKRLGLQLRRQRPRVEALEDRTNPAGFNFIPMSVVAVNPQPLPPTALMQFNPLPGLIGLPPAGGTVQIPVQIQGSFQQSLVPISPAANPVAPLPGHLSVIYSLQGGVTETVTPAATAGQPATLSATFQLTGKLTEVLIVPGATVQPAWSISTKFSEQGTVTGPLNVPTAAVGAVDIMNFTAQVTLTQVELRPAASVTAVSLPWSVQTTMQSSGKFQVNVLPGGAGTTPIAATTPFTVQDQIAEKLSPVSPVAGPPQPPIQIAGAFNATGIVTLNPLPPGPPSSPIFPPVTGTTQYQEHLTETITIPPGPTNPGSTQTVTQTFDTSGLFQNFQLWPGLTTPDVVSGETTSTSGSPSDSATAGA